VGVARIREGATAALARVGWRRAAPVVLVALLLAQGAAVAIAVKPQMEQPFYVVLTPAQYASYQKAGELLTASHRVALVDGTSSMAFSTITHRPLSFTFYPGTGSMPPDVDAFFAAGASDTRFLVERGVTIVATQRVVQNPDLAPITEGVYVLREDYASRIAAAQIAAEAAS